MVILLFKGLVRQSVTCALLSCSDVLEAFVTAFNAEGAASVDQSLYGMNFNNSYFPFSGDGREYNDFRVVNSAIGNVPAPAVFWNASACDCWRGY